MFLDEGSVTRLYDWWESAEPREGERDLVREFLESLKDGSWSSRWNVRRDLAGSPHSASRWNIWLNDELVAVADMDYDGYPDLVALTLVRTGRAPD